MKKDVAIIGFGYVGRAMHKIFPDALVYDNGLLNGVHIASTDEINAKCGLAIVCVPTPPMGSTQQKVDDSESNWLGVDISIVEDVIKQLETDVILVKSTVPPGTIDKLREKTGKRICFSPEYIGEGGYYTPPQYPDPTDPRKHDFMIIGGEKKDCEDVLSFFMPKLGPTKKYYLISAIEAELIKYMENTWGAMKVTFVNEWHEICKQFGASYDIVREGWLLDSRVERMHTAVFKDKRGFGGKCFPKDLLGIINQTEKKGYSPDLLKEVWESNKRFLTMNK